MIGRKVAGAEEMVFERGLAELPIEERNSPFCRALIEGRVIMNYVWPRTKYICGGCGEVRMCGWEGRSTRS